MQRLLALPNIEQVLELAVFSPTDVRLLMVTTPNVEYNPLLVQLPLDADF